MPGQPLDLPLITEVGVDQVDKCICNQQILPANLLVLETTSCVPSLAAAVVQLQATHDFYRNVYADPDLGPVMKVGWPMC